MSIYTLLILALCVFAVLHYFVVPQVEKSWAANRSAEKITKVGVLASFRAARTLAQLALVTFAAIAAGLVIVSLVADTSSAKVGLSVIEAAESVRRHVSGFSSNVLG